MIQSTPIKKVSKCKDLGVTISDDLKFNAHIEDITKKANSEIGRARRSFKCRKPHFLSDLYKTYIRSKLEYCPQLWNPSHTTLNLKIEKVQNRFTRLIPNGKNLTHEERNDILGITSHEERRRRGDMIFTWDILNDDTHPCKHLLEPDPGNQRRGHSKKLTKQRFNMDIFKHSFSNRIVNHWNSLDERTVAASSKNMFKSHYDSSV